jgi:hypothetical protein
MQNSIGLVISISSITLITLALIIIIAVRYDKKKRQQVLGQLADGKNQVKNNKGTGTVNGIEYWFEYFSGSKNQPSYFQIGLSLSPRTSIPVSFSVKKETAFDRFFMKHGITQEIQTGDSAFDEQFFIKTSFPDFVSLLFSKPVVRNSIQSVYHAGFNELQFRKHQLVAKHTPVKKDFAANEQKIEEIAIHLDGIAKAIIAEKNHPIPDIKQININQFVIFGLTAISLIFSIIFLIIGMKTYHPFEGGAMFASSLPYGIISFLIFSYFALLVLRGRSTSHYELIGVWATSVISFILLSFGLFAMLNGKLDIARSRNIETVILRKYYTKNKSNYTYYTIVESWRDGKREERIRVSSYQYKNIIPNETGMLIETKPGRFGYEWLVRYELLQEE